MDIGTGAGRDRGGSYSKLSPNCCCYANHVIRLLVAKEYIYLLIALLLVIPGAGNSSLRI